MDRRTFIGHTGAAIGASTAPLARPVSGNRRGQNPEIIVVGAGAIGGWTAFNLALKGAKVTLVEAYAPGNARATSGGHTRQIRADYGPREEYTRWAIESFDRWRHWEQQWGETLLVPTGRLNLVDALRMPGLTERRERLARHGVETEILNHDELAYRYPQINVEDLAGGFFEPNAAAIRARLACRAVVEGFRDLGGGVVIGKAQPGLSSGGILESVRVNDSYLSADSVVFACGPWLRTMFPELLGSVIETPRRDVFYFGTPSGDSAYSPPALPNFNDGTHPYYGFGSIDGYGVKICPVGERNSFDPETDERLVSPFQTRRAYEYVEHRFPGLRNQPLVQTRVCQLENTDDEHFIVDHHPDWNNVWIAGGGSGHAFKLGPVLGDYVAGRVLGQPRDVELDEQFRLNTDQGN
ncbi:MAG: FAD-dependent oxidoreductase [Gemmatimonadota bacterium]|nr:FAD-dependent oxidoreductase [Gemmatimonadota bacterium]MDH5803857.1 FAD-dependent oxidoreductase [Gemmatimonadota bacterium]